MTPAQARPAILTATGFAALVALAWTLAQPQLSPAAVTIRAVADGAAVVSLGLAAVQLLDEDRYRDDLMRRASSPLVVAGAVWLIAELVRLTLSAAEAAGRSVHQLSLQTALEFATGTSPGRSALFSLAAAALICLTSLLVTPTSSLRLALAGVAGVGIAARAVTGHLADGTLGAAAVAVHAIAAAVWCGMLAALVFTVSARGQWARVVPRFSSLSLISVGTLLAGGVASAVASVNAVADLYSTGYGRVLLAKIAVTLALLVLAWHNRTTWLPAARSHRMSAKGSRRKSLTELSLMSAALTLAAALTVTG